MLGFTALAEAPLADDTEVNSLRIPAASIAIRGHAPPITGRVLRLFLPAANLNVRGAAAVISTGTTVKPEQGRVTLIKRAPRSVSTGALVSPDAIAVYDLSPPRPLILTGEFSERRIKFVNLRQTGSI